MTRAGLPALALTLAAALPAAGDIALTSPLACDLGTDCYIQQYFDHDPSRSASDYRCGPLTYNDHFGTDFALRDLAQMEAGVDVLASAPGTVRATRDGMQDRIYTRADSARIEGRDCGNGVVLDHAGGWTTQYCHLKRGSITVKKGDTVRAGQRLGQVGLSGRTEFPHIQLSVRRDGTAVDPFDPDGQINCSAPSPTTLWAEPMPYQPGGILAAGFSDAVPDYAAIKAGTAARATLPTTAPALVVWGYAFGGQRGDVMRLRIDGPDGPLMDERVTLEKTQALLFRAVGKRRTTDAWPRGTWRGQATLLRRGQPISTQQTQVTIR